MNIRIVFALFAIVTAPLCHPIYAQKWDAKIRGSWISKNNEAIELVTSNKVIDIVVSSKAKSCIKVAANFLASDIEKITGKKPKIRTKAKENHASIFLATYGEKHIPKVII